MECFFRPPLYTYKLGWAKGTSWECWDESDEVCELTLNSNLLVVRVNSISCVVLRNVGETEWFSLIDFLIKDFMKWHKLFSSLIQTARITSQKSYLKSGRSTIWYVV